MRIGSDKTYYYTPKRNPLKVARVSEILKDMGDDAYRRFMRLAYKQRMQILQRISDKRRIHESVNNNPSSI